MSTRILVLEEHAEVHRDSLRAEFPFGIGLKDEFFRHATRLQWVQCLATGQSSL